MKTRRLILAFTFLFVLILQSAHSAEIQVRAIRLAENISLDGKLTEPFWKDENAITTFVQRDPVQGAPATEKTVVDVGYDDEALYIGARMYDSQPDKIIALLGRKDVLLTADRFTFFIDPYNDGRTGYYFSLNAAGTQYDGTLYNDSWEDDSWDGVWEGKTSMDDKGWTAEMRIPYSQLRFKRSEKYVWGINFKRTIARKNEDDYVVYTPKNERGFVSRFVDLVGIENISPPRRIEVMPYVTSKASFVNASEGDPFNDGTSFDPGVGVDLKLGIGTNLTLDATVNPDFGQVEVDPAVVNLSDVETFFEEKRPFFIEGSSIFNFGEGGASNYWGFNYFRPQFFYSRRIGRSPQGSTPDEADYDRVPDGTQILGATKLTGKVGNNWNIGTLHAFTGRETADVSMGGSRSGVEVEPRTYYQVSRAQKEFNSGAQGLGILTTYASRMFDDNRLRDEINSSSLAVGLDGWSFLDSGKTWVISGFTGFSNVRGTEERITNLQKNSQHYFQRPDADYLDVDEDATSLSGATGRFWINKEKGQVIFNSALGFVSPSFDVNDVGFMSRADQINGHIGGGYKWTEPGKYFRWLEMIGAGFQSRDFNLDTTWAGFWHLGYMEFVNYYSFEYSVAWNPVDTINNTRTRGGPQTLNRPGYEANVFLNTDSRKKWVFGMGGNLYESESSGYRAIRGKAEWKPAPNISASIEPVYEIDVVPAQWIDNFDDPFATHTFGSRYVFGELDQKSFSANLRLNWTFTPTLSLQLFAQPLISAGNYTNFKELARSRSYDFNRFQDIVLSDGTYRVDPDGIGPASSFTFSNPDFNFKSLRGNAILRWEYRPGSVFFFVWTQTRTDEETIGDFQLSRSLGKLWDAKPDNIFLVKFSYYWNP